MMAGIHVHIASETVFNIGRNRCSRWSGTRKYGFSAVNTIGLTPEGPQLGPPGYEINLLYIAGLVALILGGAGPLSIDALRSRRRPQRHL